MAVPGMLAGAALGVGVSAHAAGPVVEVQCPLLDEEGQASFEARAKLDLSLRVPGGGALSLQCQDTTATLRWMPTDGAERRATVVLTGPPSGWVDSLLQAGAALATRPTESTNDRPQTRAVTPRPASPPPPSPSSTRMLGWAFPLTLDGEGWSGNQVGRGGAKLGALLVSSAGWVFGAEGGAGWGIARRSTVNSAETLGGDLRLGAWFGRHRAFELGTTASVERLRVSVRDPFTPVYRDSALLSLGLDARIAVESGALRFSFGPELRIYSRQTIVRIGTGDEFTIPVVAPGLVVSASLLVGEPLR